MELFELQEAVETLERDDRALGRAIDELAALESVEARRVLMTGARRFMDTITTLKQARSERAKEWPSLAEILYTDDYLIGALLLSLEPITDTSLAEESLTLARSVVERVDCLGLLGIAWGQALRMLAVNDAGDFGYLALGYLATFRDDVDHERAVRMPDDMLINVACAASAAAMLDPENGRPMLRELFDTYYPDPDYQADVRGAVLAGLLVLEPGDEDLLDWTELTLGEISEDRPLRAYGALMGVADSKLVAARPWLGPHLAKSSMFGGAKALLPKMLEHVRQSLPAEQPKN